MNCEEIIGELKTKASDKYRANVVKLGIPKENSIGVSTSEIRGFAQAIGKGKSTELAFELWNTGYHEARLLAALLFNYKEIKFSDVEKMMDDVVSWDLCDHLCKNLIIKMKGYDALIPEWINEKHIYKKRAAFTLIASAAIHDHKISVHTLDTYLKLISEYSNCEHEHVKKAASWALREIGKKDFEYNEKALLLAHELVDSGNKTQQWIGKDTIKELESVVKTEGRTRLISTKTQMGRSQ